MVDIAASLSLTVSGLVIDPAAILGAETADNQAFSNILAEQVAGNLAANPGSGAPATPLPPFSIPAGNRQPGGKILPGAAQILPGAAQILPEVAPLGVEAPAAQVLPGVAAVPAARLVAAASTVTGAARAEPATDAAIDADVPKQAEASPVHALIKMLTAALKGQRPAAAGADAEDGPDQVEADAPVTVDAVASDASAPLEATAAPTALAFALPNLTLPATLVPEAPAPAAPRPATGSAAPILLQTAPQQADAALREQIRPALAQFLAQSGQAAPGQAAPGQTAPFQAAPVQAAPAQAQTVEVPPQHGLTFSGIQSGTQAGAPSAVPSQAVAPPVTTLAAVPAAALTLVTAPVLPVGQTVSARIKVAPAAEPAVPFPAEGAAAVQAQLAGRNPATDVPAAPVSVARGTPAERPAADPAAPAAAAPAADAQPALAAGAPAITAPALNAPAPNAPVVQMPRHDFAALVDRLVEARNASAPQSTHASLVHAEFGQVSLHFQQDGGELKVAMSSADPDFARAAQAAQAVMPAERQNLNSDANSRGPSQPQTQSQTQSQTAGNASHSHREAAGPGGERSDQPGRGGQGRNSRGGNNSSNPSPRWAGRNEAQTRGGIFA